ncbi:hypothetical protein GOODEAATRI_012358, partial [Goodea atripinnis]
EKQVAEALSTAEVWQRRHAEEAKEKSQLEMELSLLNSRISELTEQLQSVQDEGRSDREALLDRLRGVSAENMAAKLENQTLKAAASAVEEKLSLSQSELQQVKASIRQYETLLDSYKIQVLEHALGTLANPDPASLRSYLPFNKLYRLGKPGPRPISTVPRWPRQNTRPRW